MPEMARSSIPGQAGHCHRWARLRREAVGDDQVAGARGRLAGHGGVSPDEGTDLGVRRSPIAIASTGGAGLVLAG